MSADEVAFLTDGGDPQNEEVVMSLWFDGLKLLVVTDGEKGCRYFTKVYDMLARSLSLIENYIYGVNGLGRL